MRLVTFSAHLPPHLGALMGERVLDVSAYDLSGSRFCCGSRRRQGFRHLAPCGGASFSL